MVKRGSVAAMAAMSGRAAEPGLAPTDEQQQRGRFEQAPVVDVTGQGRVMIGKAYCRRPKFETIEGLTIAQFRALRAYRALFDASEVSEVKSCLDVRPRGSGGADAVLARLEVKASGSWMLEATEADLLSRLRVVSVDAVTALQTLRDVALHDLTFKDAAIKRFGGREVSRIDVKRGRPNYTTIEPRSGTHRKVIRDQFMLAADLLVGSIGRRAGGQ